MTSQSEQAGVSVFVPSVARFMLTELWMHTVGIIIGAIVMYFWGTWDWEEVATGAGLGVVFIALGAAFMRQARRVAFGDTWVSGPTGMGSESATIPFAILDVANSGFRKRRFRVQAQNGQRIGARMAWYSLEDREAIQRLARTMRNHGAPRSGRLETPEDCDVPGRTGP